MYLELISYVIMHAKIWCEKEFCTIYYSYVFMYSELMTKKDPRKKSEERALDLVLQPFPEGRRRQKSSSR